MGASQRLLRVSGELQRGRGALRLPQTAESPMTAPRGPGRKPQAHRALRGGWSRQGLSRAGLGREDCGVTDGE